MPKGGFNWRGITDNGDGTFSAASKVEKRRLLKSLHSSGYSVRSTRTSDGTWRVVAIGALRSTKRRSTTTGGYKPRTRYTGPRGIYTPISGRRRGSQFGKPPRPVIVGRGSSGIRIPRGPSLFDNYIKNRHERTVRERKEKEEMLKTDAKMKEDRIKQEKETDRKETADVVRKQEFARERSDFEHREKQRARDEQVQREKEQHRSLYDNPLKPRIVPRHTNKLKVPPKSVNATDPHVKPPHVEQLPKIDPLSLQHEREREIEGG